jgi:hypothetical protein
MRENFHLIISTLSNSIANLLSNMHPFNFVTFILKDLETIILSCLPLDWILIELL